MELKKRDDLLKNPLVKDLIKINSEASREQLRDQIVATLEGMKKSLHLLSYYEKVHDILLFNEALEQAIERIK